MTSRDNLHHIMQQTLVKIRNVKNLNEHKKISDKEMAKQTIRIMNEHEEAMDKEMNKWI